MKTNNVVADEQANSQAKGHIPVANERPIPPYPPNVDVPTLKEESPQIQFSMPLTNMIVFTGPKGATKTCQLVRFALSGLSVWDRPVFSDFPIGGYISGKYYEVQPLPDDALINYAQALPENSILIVDEMQEFFDRQDWASVRSKFGVSMAQQIRKLGLTIVGAIQFFNYLNPRIVDQVDVLAKCIDLYFTPWGRENGIERGIEGHVDYYDLSGGITGRSARDQHSRHMITGDPFASEEVYTKALWEYFDTTKLTGLDQRFKKYQIEKQVHKVSSMMGGTKRPAADLEDAVMQCLGAQKGKGKEKIKASRLAQILKKEGVEISLQMLGRIVRNSGIQVKEDGRGVYYLLNGEGGNGDADEL